MMKLVHIIFLSLCIALLFSCNGDKTPANVQDPGKGKTAVPHDHDGDGVPDHGPGAHGKKAVPHDHDGDGVPDHGPGAHGKTAVPHDHDGDGVPDHGPGEHGKKHTDPNHPSNDPNVIGEWVNDEEWKKRNDEIAKKQEEAKGKKPTAAQKETGNKICECLTKLDIYKKTISARSQADFDRLAAGATAQEVAQMQTCHTQYMKAAIRPIKEKIDRSIYGFKAREHIATKCLGGHEQFWYYMGKYVSDRTPLNPM